MGDWTETEGCLAKVHCVTCRDEEGGRSWRQSVAEHFGVPEGFVERHWACPHGVTLENLPPRPAVAAVSAPRWEPLCRHGRREGCCKVRCRNASVGREVVPAKECSPQCVGFEAAEAGREGQADGTSAGSDAR